MASRLGIDVGANSTDLLLFDEQSGQTRVLKTSAGENPVAAVLSAVDRLVADAGVNAAEITDIRVGSAEASRIVRDGSGARVGLVVTEGFEHVLHLARGRTPPRLNGWMNMAEPPVLAELAHTVGVSERIDARGQIGQPLDETQARQAIQTLLGAGVDAIVISLLHAYANPLHEKRLRDIARDMAPDLAVTISSSVLPEFREYERTVVAVLCAYLRPRLDSVFTELAGGLREHGLSPDLTIMRADGGGVSVGRAIAAPAHTILASEAGAVCGAAAGLLLPAHPPRLAQAHPVLQPGRLLPAPRGARLRHVCQQPAAAPCDTRA